MKGAKRKKWSARDKEYEAGGFLKSQSVSIFGYGEGLDWVRIDGSRRGFGCFARFILTLSLSLSCFLVFFI